MLRSLLTTLIIPLVGVGVTCYVMYYILGTPLAMFRSAIDVTRPFNSDRQILICRGLAPV